VKKSSSPHIIVGWGAYYYGIIEKGDLYDPYKILALIIDV